MTHAAIRSDKQICWWHCCFDLGGNFVDAEGYTKMGLNDVKCLSGR